jgi:hypothetical protein
MEAEKFTLLRTVPRRRLVKINREGSSHVIENCNVCKSVKRLYLLVVTVYKNPIKTIKTKKKDMSSHLTLDNINHFSSMFSHMGLCCSTFEGQIPDVSK